MGFLRLSKALNSKVKKKLPVSTKIKNEGGGDEHGVETDDTQTLILDPSVLRGCGGCRNIQLQNSALELGGSVGSGSFSLHCFPLGGPRLSPRSRSGDSSVGDCRRPVRGSTLSPGHPNSSSTWLSPTVLPPSSWRRMVRAAGRESRTPQPVLEVAAPANDRCCP